MHNIETYTYPEAVDKNAVESELDEHVSRETYEEGGSGLVSPIRWLNVTLNSEDEANQYIKDKDKGWYDQLAVKFKDIPVNKPSRKYLDLEKRLDEVRKKYHELDRKVSFSDFKSQHVSCKNCNSKLNTKYLLINKCPLCRNDMRSQTTLNTLASMQEKITTLSSLKDAEYKVCQSKNEKNAKICWLVKIEYHT